MLRKITKATVLALLISPVTTYAIPIVDTGPGLTFAAAGGATILDATQALAGQFTISESWEILSVEGWMDLAGGSATAAIYSDDGSIPGVELFSTAFAVTSVTGWQGAFGLSWVLDPGTYWLAFEVRPGQLMFGVMPGFVPDPLAQYAVRNVVSPDWGALPSDPDSSFGMRIDARPVTPVPEPGVLALLAGALIGMRVGGRRHGRRSHNYYH